MGRGRLYLSLSLLQNGIREPALAPETQQKQENEQNTHICNTTQKGNLYKQPKIPKSKHSVFSGLNTYSLKRSSFQYETLVSKGTSEKGSFRSKTKN
jgi:hypothetical protein